MWYRDAVSKIVETAALAVTLVFACTPLCGAGDPSRDEVLRALR